MREDIARKLEFKFRSANQSITGINEITQASKYSANIEVSNRDYTFARNVQFSLLPKITDAIPVLKLNISDLNIPASIELADSNFHMPVQIDILLGITGTLPQSQQQANCCLISEPSLDITVKKFFELESLPDDSKEITKSEKEIYCEERRFVSTYKRDKTGRFIVRLPIKENVETLLGYSKENAIKRLNCIWEKLNKNNTKGTLYKEFMNEYELLGHMEEIKNETLDKISYYIPHHSVYKPEKTSTPLRVVFDASAETASGFSFNSIFLNGGIIQQDLFSIVSRFRKHEDAPVKTYKLATVTYETVSAPFLATRTLKALAEEEKAEFPDAADVICNDSYMDDILSGESTLEATTRCNGRVDELLPKIISKVNNFKIPRCILLPATIRIEIHGFSDASERAYAAVVYIKCFNESGQSQTRLLCSKSRVAPLKTLTIPRLELSAALLLSRLVKKVVPILQLPIHKIWMWTDSTIALAWIKTEPHKLKTFVSNRVAEIQALSKDYHWKHVSSKNNPADLISRGCNVDKLLKNEMWFSGPDLQTDEYEDNQLFPDPSYRDELKCAVTLSMTECSSNFYELFNVTNNFIKLIRIFSFIFRFINNIKAKESCNKDKYLTADEIKRRTEFLAKIAQLSEFKAEIDALKKGKGVSKTKAVTNLTTETVIAALKRLCARRGRISTLMSDNATNFKGAAAELNRFIKLICYKNETLANYFASEAIQWKFIPPRSPNFGGLWEAGQRNKWQFEKNNVAVGSLVLLKENDLPPANGQWQES
ncbi:integrase catalytic domain-containing protein [Trichonephila clavipes]|nr:integrase catalytic domain-containing protein [Trichonephila clavipes]